VLGAYVQIDLNSISLCFRIRELVRDEGPSHCKAYGDSTKLESINLHDLHPCSWLVIEYDSEHLR
jgi:hypothetical protein